MSDEVTVGDDWSVWEALMMSKLKGNEFIIYDHFARVTASKLAVWKTNRYWTATDHRVIQIVDRQHGGRGNTGLTQTQVRYGLKKLVAKGIIQVIQYGGVHQRIHYRSFAEMKMAAVGQLRKQQYDAIQEFGTLDEMKVILTKRAVALEKKLRKIKRKIDNCDDYFALLEYDRDGEALIRTI